MALAPRNLDPAKVAKLLHQTGARHGPFEEQGLSDAAELINSALGLARVAKDTGQYVDVLYRAQKAVRELRMTLPKILDFDLSQAETPPVFATVDFPERNAKRIAAVRKLLNALCDLAPPISASKFLTHWHSTARTAFLAYVRTVGDGSKSKRGPAVRFIQLVLIECGLGVRTLGAIEKGLREPSFLDFDKRS